MLCERCQRFDVQAFGRDPYPYRGVPRLSVIRSSDHCSFCSLLLENLQEANADDSIKEITIAYQRFQQLSTRESLSFETLGLLRWLLYELINPGWVNFAVTKATKQPIVGSDGFNVVSIDAFVGSLDRFDRLMPRKHPRRSLLLDLTDPLLRPRRVKFHVAADPGEMPLFSIPDSYARVLIAVALTRHPSFNLTGYHRPNNYGQTLVFDKINRVDPKMAQRLRL